MEAKITKNKTLTGEVVRGGTGIDDYEKLRNKPSIEDVELLGNKSFLDLGLTEMPNQEILEIAKQVLGGSLNGRN